MSENEITCIHELLAKYNAILRFVYESHRPPLDKRTKGAMDALKSAFITYRDAIKGFESAIDSAVDLLEQHPDWSAFEAVCNKYEKMSECDVVKNIIKNVFPE